jgi:hypothetical protein
MADQTWTWPAGRVLVLYEWTWFHPDIGEVIGGWSQRGEVDDTGFVHLEAERRRNARSVLVYRDGQLQASLHTFSALSPLPLALLDNDGTPLPWIRTLLGAH